MLDKLFKRTAPKAEKKRRYFFDIDGVLAVFNFDATQEDLLKEGYWINRPFHANMVRAAVFLILAGEEVYILSARLENAKTALFEKNEWVDMILPMISEDNRIFTLCGQDKVASIPSFDPETDILIDDFGPNCMTWAEHGGRYVKVSVDSADADIERTRHRSVVHPGMRPEEIAKIILEA